MFLLYVNLLSLIWKLYREVTIVYLVKIYEKFIANTPFLGSASPMMAVIQSSWVTDFNYDLTLFIFL